MNEEYIKPYFRFECAPVAKSTAMIVGSTYRFTVLTSRLIRMEYSSEGKFEDRASQTVWFRDLEVPHFTTKQSETELIIDTDYLLLKYKLGKPFSSNSLSIQLKHTGYTWRYGQKDKKNLKGTARTLDGTNGWVPMKDGLLSKSGATVLDDSDALVFNESFWLTPRTGTPLDVYFFGYGAAYLDCLKDYYRITGKTPMIPRFILGNWWSRYWEYDEAELKELIQNFEKYKIPLSVCIIDMDWHLVKIDPKYGRGWTGYTWNPQLFPDPKRMLDWLHERNLKVSLNLHPADGIKAHEACYPAVADFMGVDKTKEIPVKFDIADPKFVAAYFDLVHHPHEAQGVDFWWLDWQQGFKTSLASLDPLWMLNHLHFYDLGRDKKTRSFIFSRWGNRGAHRYPIGFSGDTFVSWRSLKFQPYFTTTASNIGYGWWSHDIGGHMYGVETGELYTRWVQFGVFSPIMRLHSSKKRFYRREPWKYDANTLKMATEIMQYRHRLIPYIYSMAYLNYSRDIPLMRPFYYYTPENPTAYKFRNEYWYGSELVVAPICAKSNPKTQRVLHSFYLPATAGGFFHLFSDEFFEADRIYTRVFAIEEIPIYAKAGAIIPLDAQGTRNTTANPEQLVLEVFPGASNSFLLYEDDGFTEKYRTNENYITEISLEWADRVTLTITAPEMKPDYIPKSRTMLINFHAIESIDNVAIQSDTGLKISHHYNPEKKWLQISIPAGEFRSITISFPQPKIITASKLKAQAYAMLNDSIVHVLRKEILYKKFFLGEKFEEAELKALEKKIRYF
jgi:alpha-glucosidase (family GH31 glycosyl hydrolase)